jgi:hypothetical protein
MKKLSASYLARRLLSTEVAWPQPHREEPGFDAVKPSRERRQASSLH